MAAGADNTGVSGELEVAVLADGDGSSMAPEPSQAMETPAEPSKALSSGSYDEHPRHHMVTRAINDRMKRMPADGARNIRSKLTPDQQFCRQCSVIRESCPASVRHRMTAQCLGAAGAGAHILPDWMRA